VALLEIRDSYGTWNEV